MGRQQQSTWARKIRKNIVSGKEGEAAGDRNTAKLINFVNANQFFS